MASGRYSTRSRSSVITNDNATEQSSESSSKSRQDMSCPRSSRRKAPGCTSPPACLKKKITVPCPCKLRKCIKYLKIFIIMCLFISVIWYLTDNNYSCFLKELNKLRGHINKVEEIAQKVCVSKCDVDKQLEEITKSLPMIKGFANNLKEDIKKCGKCKTAGWFSGPNLFRKAVRAEIEEYDADKTDKVDFALESSGGKIVSTKNTVPFNSGPSLNVFGIPLCTSSNSPSALIQPGVMPGECWAFKGSEGCAVIKLLTKIYVTGVSLEHIPKSISPTGKINTAPKEFSIWGLQCVTDTNGFFFGQFQYCPHGTHVQYFPLKHKSSRQFELIEFRVHSNHGHPEYTCVYRLRVHGEIKRECPGRCNPANKKKVNKCS